MTTVDLKIQNAKVLNVFSRHFEKNILWIKDDKIVATGEQDLSPEHIFDAQGQYIVPGFIDAHVHVESSLVTPSELGKVILPEGTTSIVTDPHEIANVSGIDGIKYMLKDARQSPLTMYTMLPSSVPCAPFEHSGATLNAKDLKPLYKEPEVKGLAEVMDYPLVANHDPKIIDKINDALSLGYQVDGHGAGLSRKQLDTYRQVGISTDHECTTQQQMLDRLAEGFYLYQREGTVERDLENTIGVVNEGNAQRFAFCTDDKYITTLQQEGGINYCIQLAIKHGIRPETAYTMASYNAAQSHQIQGVGALSTNYKADLVIVSDPYKVDVQKVMKNGKWIDAKDLNTNSLPFESNTVHQHIKLEDLKLPLSSDNRCNIIDVHPNHIDTGHLVRHVPVENGNFKADLDNDILKMVVVERHHDLGTYGIGLVRGFNLKKGAFGTTFANDSHNIVVVGTNDEAIYRAIQEITKTGGGITVVNNEKVLATMPLPVAGVMSNDSYQDASRQLNQVNDAYQQISGSVDFSPFITLSFLTLPVIPTLKLTDRGVYDFDQQHFIDVEVKNKQDEKIKND